MLTLSRKPDQKIHVGDHITITIVDVTARQVRMTIDAPREVPIWRPEMGAFDPARAPAPRTSRTPISPTRAGDSQTTTLTAAARSRSRRQPHPAQLTGRL